METSKRKRLRLLFSCLMTLTGAAPLLPAEQSWTSPAFSADKARRFDFWVGEWSVNLRIKQDDLTWKDSVSAQALLPAFSRERSLKAHWS